jgi:anti-sigma regulatory factor (Ser/Thr protein kinase)
MPIHETGGGPGRQGPVLPMERTFDVDSTAPARAREAVHALAGWLTREELDDIQLLVSEITSNAVRHGGGGPIRLVVSRLPGSIRVAVTDRGDGFTPAAVEPSFYQGSGWGLFLVQELAGEWGVTREDGTTVWFELPVGSEGGRTFEGGGTRR